MNKLIKILVGGLFFLVVGEQVYSQQPKKLREKLLERIDNKTNRIDNIKENGPGAKILMLKEKFISNKLNLTEEQTKAFTPVYRQYQDEKMKVNNMIRINKSLPPTSDGSGLDVLMSLEQQALTIKKHYKDEFLKILPPDKVAEVFKSEEDFNKEVIKQLNERSIRSGD